MRTLVSILLLVAALPAAASDGDAPWELKGLRLGASLAQVQAAAPGLECEVEAHDPELTYCLDRDATPGGEHAMLAVKLLDGEAVYIGLENLSVQQMKSAVPTLMERFGPPTESGPVRGDVTEQRTVRTVFRPRHVWRGRDGAVVLAEPFDWTDTRRGITYANICLMHEAKRQQWALRYHTKNRARDL